jgi:hypothetical protein
MNRDSLWKAPRTMWALCNYGNVINIFYLRKQAVEAAKKRLSERNFGYENWKDVYEVRKVRVSPE